MRDTYILAGSIYKVSRPSYRLVYKPMTFTYNSHKRDLQTSLAIYGGSHPLCISLYPPICHSLPGTYLFTNGWGNPLNKNTLQASRLRSLPSVRKPVLLPRLRKGSKKKDELYSCPERWKLGFNMIHLKVAAKNGGTPHFTIGSDPKMWSTWMKLPWMYPY